MRSFGSDNHSGVHPRIFEAIARVQNEQTPSYGTDSESLKATELFRSHFAHPVDVFYVFNGTGANVLGLSGLVMSYESVLCAETSHLNQDECGAPEVRGGFKLIPVATADGKLTPEHVLTHVRRRGDQHFAQLRAISITQPTEFGTLYTCDEMKALSDVAKAHGLYFHMDGARFILAAERLRLSFAELTRDIGVDVLSFGGTKNGLMMGEAVVVFNPNLRERYKFLRKQLMQLPSKTKFIGAQFRAFLQDELWRDIATHSCEMAGNLARELLLFKELKFTHPVQTNALFLEMPKHYVSRARKRYFFYVWDERSFQVRLMTSFDTTSDDVQGFVQLMKELTLTS